MKWYQCKCPECGFEFGFTVTDADATDELIKECAECPCGAQCDTETSEI